MRNKRPKRRLVDPKNWKNMEGENPTIKKINSYLTCHFIWNEDIPPDECLREARKCVEEYETCPEEVVDRIEEYLTSQFAPENALVKRDCFDEASMVVDIIEKGMGL